MDQEPKYSSGRGVGSFWLWLVPIVVGWLWVPFSSYDRLRAAIDKANDLAFVAAPDDLPRPDGVEDSPDSDCPPDVHPPRRTYDIFHIQAVRMSEKSEVFTRDATRTAPVFNYARMWDWWWTVEVIAQAFEHADKNAENHVPVDDRREWVLPGDRRTAIHDNNRIGTIGQVRAYCGFHAQWEEEPVRPVPSGVRKRIFIASVFALGLQWGTTGSAAMIQMLTPTTGLGCRSGSFLLHGVVSTVIWLALILSGYLAHYAKTRHDHGNPPPGSNAITVAKGLATFLRRLSIFAASCNALWIVLACLFQFSNFYNTCYCNSSVLGRGAERAFNLIVATGHDNRDTKDIWAGGFALAGMCVGLYLFFLGLMLEPSHDARNR